LTPSFRYFKFSSSFSLLSVFKMADTSPIDHSRIERLHPETASERTVDIDEQPQTVSDEKAENLPPDGGYGWVCVACNFMINGHTWGLNSTYGVFLGASYPLLVNLGAV
jgi:hypothetical protein